MKIGMFTYSTQPRGSVVHAACLSEALARRGEQITLFALSKNQSPMFRDVACHTQLLPAADAPLELDALIAQRIAELVRGLLELSPALDVLHAQDCLVASALLEARRHSRSLSSCPLLRTVHHVERFESPYLAECQRRSIMDADVLLSVSQATDDDVWAGYGRRGLRVSNGVDLARFARATTRAGTTRRTLGLADDAFIVLCVGGVEPRKNSLLCLEAMTAVMAQAPEVFWLIAGGESVLDHRAYQDRFEQQLATLPRMIQSRIVRTGRVEEQELTDLYGASDILLCASQQEGFGLCVLEAAAARRPVVVSCRPPFSEYLPEQAALFVDPDSPAAIAGAVLRLRAEPPLRQELEERGHAIARELSWERSAAEHARAYRIATDGGLRASTQRRA